MHKVFVTSYALAIGPDDPAGPVFEAEVQFINEQAVRIQEPALMRGTVVWLPEWNHTQEEAIREAASRCRRQAQKLRSQAQILDLRADQIEGMARTQNGTSGVSAS